VTTNGALVLDVARAHLQRFVTFPSQAAADLCTLWAVHTHARTQDEHLAFTVSPRLLFLSDKRGSGKSQAMQRVLGLSFHGRMVIDPTPLSFATMVSRNRASVAIDELDCLFGAGQAKQQLRGLLNAGYTPGAEFARGKDETIDVFSPLVMAGLGARIRIAPELEPLRSRSIIVEMLPATPPEFYERDDHDGLTAMYRDQLTTWVKRNLPAILKQRPDMPAGIELRMREVCRPLFAIADTAGGHWPNTARDAARQMLLGEMSESNPDELTLHERLLLDLRTVYADQAKMSTHDITASLDALPASTWTAMWPNRNKAARELAVMLEPLGAAPTMIRFGEETMRGYHRYMLEPLWDEIVSDENDVTDVAATQAVTLDLDEDELLDA
jgi:hypothetical protein